MPSPLQEILVVPPTTSVRVELDPARNILHSLVLLAKSDHYYGLNEWVERTAAGFSPEMARRHHLVIFGFYYAWLPEVTYPDFPAYLRLGEWLLATGVVEQDARLVVLPKPLFDELLATHAPFRQYVFSLFAERLTELMALVEAMAFHKLDRRLAGALLGHGRVVAITHQQLADEVGSVREIVTRVLRSFADHGLVRLSRGSVEVLDAGGLRRMAEGI